MKEIKIQKATKKDLENLVILRREFVDYHHDLDSDYVASGKSKAPLRKFFIEKVGKKNEMVWIAYDGKNPVGYIYARIKFNEIIYTNPTIGDINNLFVEKKYRGKGVGKLLIKEALNWFKNEKIKRVFLKVTCVNVNSIGFYRKMGFEDFALNMKIKI